MLASLAGIILISSVDLTGNNDKNRGSFPHKSHKQLAIGDALALASALLYGIYTTVMKKRIGDESRVDMALFFGFVGLFNLITLLPGFPILHYTGIETFEIPPTKRITAIILVPNPRARWEGIVANFRLDQLRDILGCRLLLGIFNAAHVPIGCDRRVEPVYTTIPLWADDLEQPDL